MKPSPIVKLPAYRQVMDAIEALAHGKAAGERLGTEKEFVEMFGVSLVTVRQALQRLENDGVIERRQGIGTFIPLEQLPRRHVAVYLETDPLHPRTSRYFPTLVRETRKALAGRGISSRSYFGLSSPQETLDGQFTCDDLRLDYRLGRLSGIVAVCVSRVRQELEKEGGPLGIPLLDGRFRESVGWSGKSGFLRLALERLKAEGRRRIGVLAWENPTLKFKPFHAELLEMAREVGIAIDERLWDLNASALETGMGWERFRDLWRVSASKPDGLIILDDMIFHDCQKAIHEMGLSVPEQLSVVLYTSDAQALEPFFPVHVYRLNTRSIAERYAGTIEAMIRQQPLPELPVQQEWLTLADAELSSETLTLHNTP